MNENSDDLDLATCSRHARRWTIGLVCLLTFNLSLVALALGGYGVRPTTVVAVVPPPAETAPAPVLPAAMPAAPEIPASQPAPANVEPVLTAKMLPLPVDPIPPQPVEPQPEPTPVVPPAPPAPLTPADPPLVAAPAPPPVPAPAPAPTVVVAPPENELPEVAADALLVVNPGDTGGAVHFVVEGVVHSLAPGEFCELPGRRNRRVEYHRGDEFGFAQHDLESGPHTFGLGEKGWTLQPLTSVAARKLLTNCRLKSTP